MPMPCLAAVDRQERMAQKFWAPVMDRMQPETLIRSLPILISRSAALLPRSDRGAGRPGPPEDGGFEEFRELAPSLARNSATSARSTLSCARSTDTSVPFASITCRSRALAARSAASSPGADGRSGTSNH